MKRILGFVLVLVLLAGCAGTLAEGLKAPDFILEGFDGEDSLRDWESNVFFQRMEERTGVSFQFREFNKYSKWQERKTAILGGDDLPDVLFKAELEAGEIRDMYAAGVLIDLKPYLEKYAPDLWKIFQENPDILDAVSMEDGAIPALPNINDLQNNDVMWINSTWLKRVGMDMPETAEELTEVLRAFRDEDPNANGKKDEIPLTFISMWELRFLGHAFGIVDNDYYVTLKDGKVTSSLTSDENRAFLTWLHELWTEKLIDHNGFTTADGLRQITDDNTSIPYGVIMSSSPLTVVPTSSMGAYRILLPLKYNSERVYRDLAGRVVRGAFAITSRCKEPEKLISWVNYLYTDEGSMMAQYGLEGKEYGFREDGLWEWNEDESTVAQYVLTMQTIGGGAAVPGRTPVEFQEKYVNEATRTEVKDLLEFRNYTKLPYPQILLGKTDEQVMASIQKDLSSYAEATMARFVTGDIPLDDEQWKIFCETVEQKGLSRAIAIWQKYIK